MGERISFDRRYQGFEHGALGGYAAGVVARHLDGPVEANLRALPPLERELEVRPEDDGSLQLLDGETLVLEARPTRLALDVPAAPDLEAAEAASERLVHEEVDEHIYPSCFTCGPAREPGDGLRLFMGRAEPGGEHLVSAWTPHPDLGDVDGALPGEFVWAALDCPSIWAAGGFQEGLQKGFFLVLARQRVEQLAPVPLGSPSIVTSWPIERDGRKHVTGAAIHDPAGALLARCEALLVEVPIPNA